MGASHTTLASGGLDDGGMPDLSVARIGGTGSGGGGGDSDPRTNATTSNTNTSTTSSNTMTGGGGGGRGSDGGGGAGSSNDLADHYVIEHHLFPGSGRMMRTMTCRHKKHGSFMILKSMWVSRSRWEELKQAQVELQRIQQALQGTIHLAPFCHWSVGDYRTRAGSSSPVCPVYLARPYFYTTLSDRLASRPFLTPVEKLWIIYQLLQALDTLHSRGVVHGFLTTENIGLSSWNWVVLVDLASSHKARTALPDDDPSEYLYYFQELYYTQQQQHHAAGGGTTGAGMDDWNNAQQRHQHHHSGRSREKRCYLAPERFHTSSVSSSTPGTATSSSASSPPPLTPAMDIFSAGCVIMETFLNGERALDLGDLMEYRNQQHHIHHHDDDPQDDDTPTTPTNTPPPFKNVKTSSTSSSGSTASTTRNSSGLTPSLQQKLNKIEFSAVRAACKHMIQLDPSQRLDAATYLERLQAKLETASSSSSSSSSVPETSSSPAQQQQLIPPSFDNVLAPLMERVTYCATPDARLAIAASHYCKVLWETMGIRDDPAKEYMEQLLGPTMVRLEEKRNQITEAGSVETGTETDATTTVTTPPQHIPPRAEEEEEKKSSEPTDLFAETAALLRQLESLTFDNEDLVVDASRPKVSPKTTTTASTSTTTSENKRKDVSPMSKSSLLIYLQLILSTVPHVQRPASKLVALQLMSRLAHHSSDEARLQRIVPSTVSLLQDQDPLVRASAIQVLAHTLSIIETFPPSDSNVFPQYIFKRVTHMITDPSLVVRVAFAESVPVLAETSHRFLDISHAVRLYEAVGGGTGGGNCGGGTGTTISSSASLKDRISAAAAANRSDTVFGDDIAKLLDDSTESRSVPTKKDSFPDVFSTIKDSSATTTTTSASEAVASAAGRTLISSTYNSELAALHETVSRWVVHITTDQSEHSSPPKRALLGDLARLCNFFGLDGVMAFILPQILSFLNDRKDWQLRATLFEVLPSVCQMIGRAATEHFVLPCLETALVDSEEPVICRALRCLSELLELGLLSRSALIGGGAADSGLLKKYGALLVHPSVDIRFFAISIVNASCKALGFPDGDVFVVPLIRPYLRFEPSSNHLTTPQGLEKCLQRPWTRQKFQEELERFLLINQALSPTSGQWTSIGIQVREGGDNPINETTSASRGEEDESSNAESEIDLQTKHVRAYLQLLGRSRAHSLSANSGESDEGKPYLRNGIEGPLKLAQHIKCPRQDVVGLPSATLPAWYSSLRDTHECKTGEVSESAAIRSVSALGQVFGLSIMDQSVTTPASAGDMTAEEALRILQSEESKTIQAACTGEWGSETCLDPALTDTSLLVGKLNALQVPPLPPRLTEKKPSGPRITTHRVPVRADGTNTTSADWKPKIDSMVASSSISPALGHTAPVVRMAVSPDQRFFVTGSHDGTCRVWELEKAERCAGVLESSITYSGHCPDRGGGNPRLNDLSMVEGSHSVVSGASDGSIHVWRVDMVSSKPSTSNDGVHSYERSRVVGSSEVRRLDPIEGEILAVNHFNSSAASVLMFGTQKGNVHSWDLRCAKEPFILRNAQGTGYLTSMGIGSDRHWVVTGSSKGFLALWDIRFQQQLKLWHHSRCAPINRVATSFVPPPQSWIGKNASNAAARPFVFVACGPNEVAMFDVSNGACRECFRTVDYGSRHAHAYSEELPMLKEIPLTSSTRQQSLMTRGMGSRLGGLMSSSFLSTNAMVGSIGASDTSFLITGGSDCRIRHWDFIAPSKCYVISGLEAVQPRPSFERIDYDQRCRVMLCRQAPSPTIAEVESSRVPGKLFQGLKQPENHHHDSIQDLKIVNSGLLSCSRDCTVKLWR